MASFSFLVILCLAFFACTLCFVGSTSAQLTPNFYSKSCPKVIETVRSVVQSAVAREKRLGASLLRLHFHDCFINGCDGSVLLDDTPTFRGEKTALANNNSIRGFEVIDAAKCKLEEICPGVVSCADILAISALESVLFLKGPSWQVKLGRRDSRTASFTLANTTLPSPFATLRNLIDGFNDVGLSTRDMVALSGAHTIGLAQCLVFRTRIYNDTNIDPSFARARQSNCPSLPGSGNTNLAPLDLQTPTRFDNSYYQNLVKQKGLLQSDQRLHDGGSTDSLVDSYSENVGVFYRDFARAMVNMGDLRPLTGSRGEIRKNCRMINS